MNGRVESRGGTAGACRTNARAATARDRDAAGAEQEADGLRRGARVPRPAEGEVLTRRCDRREEAPGAFAPAPAGAGLWPALGEDRASRQNSHRWPARY